MDGGAGPRRYGGRRPDQRQARLGTSRRGRQHGDGALSLLRERGHAKINLALHVRRRGADGYHDLETLFAFAEDGDELSFEPGAGLSLRLTGPFAEGLSDGPDNLVLRAASQFFETFAPGAGGRFHLVKNLPVASGIGGGSADAGAALRMLARHHGVGERDARLTALAARLGADVPACLASRTARGEGRGDALRFIDGDLAGTPLLLVNPRVPLATGDVFRGWDGIDRGPLAEGDPLGGRNDLEVSAQRIVPAIGDILDRLGAQPGVRIARMSGSGATCFALFESEAARDAAARALADERRGWWSLVSRLR